MDHPDQDRYREFCRPAVLRRSVNMLVGIVEGIGCDGNATDAEKELLVNWMMIHQPYERVHPFNEFFPVLTQALDDGRIDETERSDILWLASKVINGEFEASTKRDMQVLHGILQGVTADGKISENEVYAIKDWVLEHDHLKTIWPFDEIEALVIGCLSDGVFTKEEHDRLYTFLSDFCELKPESDDGIVQHSITGVCALCPEIEFKGTSFCFTGSSSKMKRKDFELLVESMGGRHHPRVVSDLDYLVVGGLGNPCWAYACYGRKVEQAMKFRKSGATLTIIHENDFWDAVNER